MYEKKRHVLTHSPSGIKKRKKFHLITALGFEFKLHSDIPFSNILQINLEPLFDSIKSSEEISTLY